MTFPSVFQSDVVDALTDRIEQLRSDTTPQWGVMNAAQMLAHCCVSYEMVFENKHARPNALLRFVLKLAVKNTVVGDAPYKHNTRTAPAFIIRDKRNFEKEKQRLIVYLRRVQLMGEVFFEGKVSLSFGPLTAREWNVLFYKHLDHHLAQFGV